MIPKTSDRRCSAHSRQRSTRANPSMSSAGHAPQGILWDSCRVGASADGATVARISTHGSWAPHLYDAHQYHQPIPEHVPTLRAVPESGITDEGAQTLMGVAFVLLPLMLAAWGWSM